MGYLTLSIKVLIVTFIFIFFSSLSYAAPVYVGKALTYGHYSTDISEKITVDGSGSIYTCGSFEDRTMINGTIINASRGKNLYLAKFSDSQKLEWIRIFALPGQYFALGHCTGLALDREDNIIMVGNTNGQIIFIPQREAEEEQAIGQSDYYAAKFNSLGELLWVKVRGNALNDEVYDVAIDESSSDIFITGRYQNAGSDPIKTQGFVIRLDGNSGREKWKTIIAESSQFSYDVPTAVKIDEKGQLVVVGYTGEGSTSRMFLAKLDSETGNLLFYRKTKNEGSPGNFSSIGPSDVSILSEDNGIVITGLFVGGVDFSMDPNQTEQRMSAGASDIFVSMYDEEGNYLWTQTAGGEGDEVATSAGITSLGNVYVTGRFTSQFQFGSYVLNPPPQVYSSPMRNAFVLQLSKEGFPSWAGAMSARNPLDRTWKVYGFDLAVKEQIVYITGGYHSYTTEVDLNPTNGYDFHRTVGGSPAAVIGPLDAYVIKLRDE